MSNRTWNKKQQYAAWWPLHKTKKKPSVSKGKCQLNISLPKLRITGRKADFEIEIYSQEKFERSCNLNWNSIQVWTKVWYKKTSMKWISYQINTSYNELHLINSGISRWERERARGKRDKFCVINVKCKEISWRVRGKKKRKKVTSRSTE